MSDYFYCKYQDSDCTRVIGYSDCRSCMLPHHVVPVLTELRPKMHHLKDEDVAKLWNSGEGVMRDRDAQTTSCSHVIIPERIASESPLLPQRVGCVVQGIMSYCHECNCTCFIVDRVSLVKNEARESSGGDDYQRIRDLLDKQ